MQLNDNWYCDLCGCKIEDGKRLCPACLEQEVTKTRQAIMADGVRAKRTMTPESAMNVLTAVYTNESSQYIKDALALGVQALTEQGNPKKNQPHELGGNKAGFEKRR
jgi:hypothetical protein